jgi:hypothetical protein
VHRHEVGSPQPQGSSLLPELCCLEPSSLNRPHPPHSWAHRIFTAWRLIRDAFAVRERLGDPRVVPGFRYPFCPGIPSSPTPGSSIIVSSSAAMSTRPSPRVDRLGTPKTPAIRFTRAMTFVASWFTHLLRSASLLAPCTDLTGYPASGAFTSGLSAGWSPFPLQDITTTATGLLCWRDSHPLEWQLASLHLLLHRDGLAPSTPSLPVSRRTPVFPRKQTRQATAGMSQMCPVGDIPSLAWCGSGPPTEAAPTPRHSNHPA